MGRRPARWPWRHLLLTLATSANMTTSTASEWAGRSQPREGSCRVTSAEYRLLESPSCRANGARPCETKSRALVLAAWARLLGPLLPGRPASFPTTRALRCPSLHSLGSSRLLVLGPEPAPSSPSQIARPASPTVAAHHTELCFPVQVM